ncbi:hypothetical protein R1flu_002037 [Riccia fluitans]|uniref:Uncharacterized protein n=1 Tax=Riccia fluitans TaxID=41844 RepID=A0ABD1Y7X9_9MARC
MHVESPREKEYTRSLLQDLPRDEQESVAVMPPPETLVQAGNMLEELGNLIPTADGVPIASTRVDMP